VFKSFAVLVLFVPLLSVVFAQEDEEGDAPPSLLLTNYNALREEGQGFYLRESSSLYEKPDSGKTSFVTLHWWCDLEFSSEDATTNKYGYVGRAIRYLLGSTREDAVAQGSQIPTSKKQALSVSAVLVPTLGVFEGQIHPAHDDLVVRYWDDGSSALPLLAWEGHDEGDTSPNADTSAWSDSGTLTKITTEAAAELLGMDVVDLTPAACSMEYEVAWNATHVPDPIDTSVTDLEETVDQLQADNKELLSRIVAIEGLTARGSGSSGDDKEAMSTSSSSPFMAAFEHATTDIVVKAFMTVAVSIGLVLFL
jgi:hypothetical protein